MSLIPKTVQQLMRQLDTTLSPAHILPSAMSSMMMSHPPIDLAESPKHFELKTDVPGLSKKEIELRFPAENTVALSHQSTAPKVPIRQQFHDVDVQEDDSKKYWVVERPMSQSFYREIRLPSRVDVDHVKASLHDGVLTVTLPKKHADKEHQGKAVAIE